MGNDKFVQNFRNIGKCRHRLEDDIKIDVRGKEYEGGDWSRLAQCMVQRQVFKNTITNLLVP
jgi:hypothetical protein